MSTGKDQNKTEECLKRIQNHQGVIGVILTNQDGIPIRSTMDNSTTLQYSNSYCTVFNKCRSAVRTLDPQNDLDFVRIKTRKHEVMLAPDKDIMMISIQTSSE